ncbi:MAG: DUF952 domain-containing protein, partial [Pseudomonadota bacterium]
MPAPTDPAPHKAIFKIFTPADWDALERDGTTRGSALDRTDGFLHFSTDAQLAETLALHFRSAGELVLARVPLSALRGREVRWEAARGGTLFPHLYGLLERGDIDRVWRLSPDSAGLYELPEL